MSSRAEEKARRKAERQAIEAEAARFNARRAKIRLGAAALTAAVVIAAIVVAIGSRSGGGTGDPRTAGPDVPIPGQRITDLEEAASAARCKLTSPPVRGQEHVDESVEYEDNPPSSGDHDPEAALDGIYEPGASPEPENWVHSLEHGRVVVQYRPRTTPAVVGQLETVVSEELEFGRPAYLTALLENTTDMEPAVVAVAWGQLLSCDAMNPRVFDAIRAFRTEYTDRGPEVGIPPTN